MEKICWRRFLGVSLSVLLIVGKAEAQFEQGFPSCHVGTIPCTTLPSSANTVTYTSLGDTPNIVNILRFKFNELALTGSAGSPYMYFPSAFTATAKISVSLWTLGSDYSGTATIQNQPETLTVNYDPTPGNKYTPISYLKLNTNSTMYGQVSVTVDSVTVTGQSGSWTTSNIDALLTVENEMDVLRYFTMSGTASSLTPTFMTPDTSHSDEVSVSWTFPAGANNNFSQLEYAWVENETQAYYDVSGSFSTNAVFQQNSTRIDINDSGGIFKYNIPLLYDANPATGGGLLYYRVRAVQRQNDGNMIAGPWSTPLSITNKGHEDSLNWQVTTDFAEDAKSKTVIQYYDGTLRPRQTVTKDNSTGNTVVAETIYDLQGRPNVQILPTPTDSTEIRYFKCFNLFNVPQGDMNSASYTVNPARYFDLALPGTQCTSSPPLDTTKGNGKYYSAANPWIGIENTANLVPNAKGYAYTETRYTDDPTQRVSVQGGAGQAYQIDNGHTTNYFYGQPEQNELDALFGTEAGLASHYFKNMVEDANGQMSISYVDMHGRTVATALAGSAGNMTKIYNDTAFYPSISGTLTDSMLTQAGNVITGDSIQSTSTILVPITTAYNFNYQLTPPIFQQANCNQQKVCFDCKYNLEISIRKEGCSDTPAIVMDYNNLQIVPANAACGSPMGFVGEGHTTPMMQIDTTISLTPGSWVVRKTLKINDSVMQVREDSALNAFLCKTQQSLADSVLNAMKTASNCSIPAATRNCTACQAATLSYSAFKTNYLASLGGIVPTDSAIHALYSQDSLDCQDACGLTLNPAMTTLGQLRAQMINDMIPYSGQYALPTNAFVNSSLQARYNIFATSYSGTFGTFGTKPFYRNPVSEPNGVGTYYSNGNSLPDSTIYPGGVATHLTVLDTISPDAFTEAFDRDWANQLIYYHPEYTRLRFAEDTIPAVYTWLDQVLQCDSYTTAVTQGYTNPLNSDAYFIYNSNAGYVPSDRTKMSNYINVSLNPDTTAFSMWQVANAMVLVDSTQPVAVKRAQTAGLNKTGVNSGATPAQQDAIWQAFRSEYLSYRNNMVVNYINSKETYSLSTAAMDTLQSNGKLLRFANDSAIAAQNGATWWDTATNLTHVDSIGLMNLTATYVADSFPVDQCTAERVFWQGRLEECEVLQQYLLNQDHGDSVLVNSIVNSILDSMVMVCHLSINGSNPAGATNVNPTYLPVDPANFENIINHVFANNHIPTTTGSYFCNPYTIDYPKPFNSNPPLFVNYRASADTCNCDQFAMLKSAAGAAGVDTTKMAAMNSYLRANYNDTLSLALWQGLQQCGGYNWYDIDTVIVVTPLYGEMGQIYGYDTTASYINVLKSISLGALSEIPAFLSCGYIKPCITCNLVAALTDSFHVLFPAYAAVPYTSGAASVDTGMAQQNALWARYLNYKTGFSNTANAYITALLNCQDSGVANLLLTNRTTQPPVGSAAPALYTASTSVSFDTGYVSQSGDEFETQLGGSVSGINNGLCSLNPPVTYITPSDTTVDGCQSIEDQANFIAQMLFKQLQDSLISNFDSTYRAQCFSVQSTEVFYATYQPTEYHYTLYYYDQAGNLVKTLPPAAVQPNYSPTYFAAVASARAANVDMTNGTNIESLATQYRYNTLNQVISQQTPDAGTSYLWYDRLGRLAVSQNAKQAGDTAYSYTMYDPLGRIIEVGQKPQATAMTQTISQDTTALAAWLANLTTGKAKVQITRTGYDSAYCCVASEITGMNLRNRVAYSMVIDVDNINVPYRAATFYSYDPHGNVDSLLQDYDSTSVMGLVGNRFKLMVYNYDLISGKVNQVSYQPGLADAFYHQYSYDAENRITNVRTSTDSIEWQNDASYTYYRHGPLARVQVGDLQLQGIDYAYTVQGWLKSINPSWITPSGTTNQYDSDGIASASGPALFERDAYKLNLNYYDDGIYTDYMPVHPQPGYVQGNSLLSSAKNNLYNGNISSLAINIRQLGAGSGKRDGGPMLYNYNYDQLNRISSMDAWRSNDSLQPINVPVLLEYAERYCYDPNGNIMKLKRNGDSANLAMDNLTYKYIYARTGGGTGEFIPGAAPTSGVAHLTNQLSSISDSVTDNTYTGDIKTQAAFNYQYDAIGELTADAQSEISGVKWNVYGKILCLTDSTHKISFTYDAAGNRISKTGIRGMDTTTTWYVRDAQGNVMSVYTQGNPSINGKALTQAEADLYGSSRLGLLDLSVNCAGSLTQPLLHSLVRGNKLFELTNHLGNVLATISDKKLQHTSDNSTVDYYQADVINANDYYSFGMPMPSRNYTASTATNYRYGFNGKEQDNEVKGPGDQYDYGMRMYDPRVGRFLSVDPLAKKYAWYTPYQFAGNKPILAVDLDGREDYPSPEVLFAMEHGLAKVRDPKASELKLNIEAGFNSMFDLPLVGTTFKAIVAPLDVYEYTNRNNNQRDPKIRAENSNMAASAAVNTVAMWGTEQLFGLATDAISDVRIPYTKEYSDALNSSLPASPNGASSGSKPPIQTVTLYRGVNESNFHFDDATQGIAQPNGGSATPLQHNTVSTLNSPYSSWTTDPDVALNFALRPIDKSTGTGRGVVLTADIPQIKLFSSPNTKRVQLIQDPSRFVSESEVLVTGKVEGADVQHVTFQTQTGGH